MRRWEVTPDGTESYGGGNKMNSQSDEIRRKIVPILKNYGVRKAALFGSIVRGKVTEKSDIDLLVEFVGRKSLLDLAGLKIDLQDLLKREVDALTYASLHPLLKEKILGEQERIL